MLLHQKDGSDAWREASGDVYSSRESIRLVAETAVRHAPNSEQPLSHAEKVAAEYFVDEHHISPVSLRSTRLDCSPLLLG